MIELLHGDCMELMPNNFDVCITDPPYGINFQSSRMIKRKRHDKILNDDAPFIDWISPLFNKMNDRGRLICFYRWDVQDEFIDAIKDAGFNIKSQIIWDKVIHGMGDLKGEFSPQHECMIYATKGRYEFTGNRPKSIYRVQRVTAGALIHPNEKPVPLLRQLIRDLSCKQDFFFDPFLGSGSMAESCFYEAVRLTGTEKHKDYYNAAVKRFNLVTSQTTLF